MELKKDYYTSLQVILNGEYYLKDEILRFVNRIPVKLYSDVGFIIDECNKGYIDIEGRHIKDSIGSDKLNYTFDINDSMDLELTEYKDDKLTNSLLLHPYKTCALFDITKLGKYENVYGANNYILYKRPYEHVFEIDNDDIRMSSINLKTIKEIEGITTNRVKILKK